MLRRDFLKTVGIAALALGADVRAQGRRSGRTKNFVWMRPDLAKRPEDWTREFSTLRAAGIDAVNVEIYNGREAFYESRRFPVKAAFAETVIPLAAAQGLEVHAWMWTLPCNVDEVRKNHPDWYNVNAKGESAVDKPAYVDYYRFLDPARPEVREFVRDTVKEIAQIRGLTGIHLDYVRHPDAILPSGLWSKYGIVQDKVYPPYDYGYTDFSRRAFKAKHGIDPMDLKDPEATGDWMKYRLDTVVDLVNEYLVPAAHAGGKTITAAVFPGPSLARVMVRQDWSRFNLDAVLPMLYHGFYQADPGWVKKYTEEAVATVKQPVYSGIYVPGLSSDELARTIAMALDGGAYGISIFDLGAMDAGKWQTVAAALAR